jgi:hypothetical protein
MLDPSSTFELFTFRGGNGHGISCRIVSSSIVYTVYTTPVSNSKSSFETGVGRDYVIENVFDLKDSSMMTEKNNNNSGTKETSNNRKRERTRKKKFTTLCFNHVHKTLWRSRLTVHVNGILRDSKRLVYPPASNMSPVIDGYIGGPRGQLGRILFLSKSITQNETDHLHYLLNHSLSFTLSRPSINMKHAVPTDIASTWTILYDKHLILSYDARHHRIIQSTANTSTRSRSESMESNNDTLSTGNICVVMDTGPSRNDGAILSLDHGTVPMTEMGGSIADAFACSGGGFRLLLPILLMSTRNHPEFANLTTFAEVIVPHLILPFGFGSRSESKGETKNGTSSNGGSSDFRSSSTMSSILNETVSLLASLLRSDRRNLNLFLQRNGIECLSWIFLRVPGSFITLELWESCKRLCFAMRDGAHGPSEDSSEDQQNQQQNESQNKSQNEQDKDEQKNTEGDTLPLKNSTSFFAIDSIDIFSVSVSCLLFDLRIWARGTFEVHGNILNNMSYLIHKDNEISDAIDVQSMFDSLHDLYGGEYGRLRSSVRNNSGINDINGVSSVNRIVGDEMEEDAEEVLTNDSVRKGWNDINYNDRCALRHGAMSIIEGLLLSSETTYIKRRSALKCLLRFVSNGVAHVTNVREHRRRRSSQMNASPRNQNTNERQTSSTKSRDRQEYDHMLGLVTSCSEILVRLVSSCRHDPSTLYLLSESSLHQCMWQLLLAGLEIYRRIGISLLRMILSVGCSLDHYIRRSLTTAIDDSSHPLHERDTSFCSPWDSWTEQEQQNVNGSGSGSATSSNSMSNDEAVEQLTKMERSMYKGCVTPSLSAHVLYCLRHSSVETNLLDGVLHLMLDGNIENDEANGFDGIVGTRSLHFHLATSMTETTGRLANTVQYVPTRNLLLTVYLDLILMPTTRSSVRCLGIKSLWDIVSRMSTVQKNIMKQDRHVMRKLTLLCVLVGQDEREEEEEDEDEVDGEGREENRGVATMQGETKYHTSSSPPPPPPPPPPPDFLEMEDPTENYELDDLWSTLVDRSLEIAVRQSVAQRMYEMNTENSIELMHRHLYRTHDAHIDSNERTIYDYIVNLLLPKTTARDEDEDDDENNKTTAAHVATKPTTAQNSISYGTVGRIVLLDVLVDLIGTDSEALMHATTTLKMSCNDLRTTGIRPIEINNAHVDEISIIIRTILTRINIQIVEKITTRTIRPLRLSGALRWDGASESAQLWNSCILIVSHSSDVILGNTFTKRPNFGDDQLDPLDPLEDLILITLQFWGVLVGQLNGQHIGQSDSGHGGSHDEAHSEDNDNGVDLVPVRSGGGLQDEESSDDEDEYFMMDPTLQMGAIRPMYPMISQHAIHLCLYVLQHFLSTPIEYGAKAKSALGIAEMTRSMLKLMNVLSSTPSMVGVKTQTQYDVLLWLAPRLVGLHHLIASSSSESFTGANKCDSGDDNNSNNHENSEIALMIENLLELVLVDIIPTLKSSNTLAAEFKDVLYDNANAKPAPWTSWVMHMAGSAIFLQQKIMYESRMDRYRNDMKMFIENIERLIEKNVDNNLSVHMNAMRGRASIEANARKRSLRHQEIARRKASSAQRKLRNIHTVQGIQSTLEELVCMHAGTPWSDIIPKEMEKNMYFWTMDEHETNQRMRHRVYRRLKSTSPHHYVKNIQNAQNISRKNMLSHEQSSIFRRSKLEEEKLLKLELCSTEQADRLNVLSQLLGLPETVIPKKAEQNSSVKTTHAVQKKPRLRGESTGTTIDDLTLTQQHARPRTTTTDNIDEETKSSTLTPSKEGGRSSYDSNDLQRQASTVRAELAFKHQELDASRKEEEASFATVAQLVLPMCTVHGRIELTKTSLYFYADGFAGKYIYYCI